MIPIYDTHNTFAEGGRKIHILNEHTRKCLCGYRPGFFYEVDISFYHDSVTDYISQPDTDGNICRRCKVIFSKRFQNE